MELLKSIITYLLLINIILCIYCYLFIYLFIYKRNGLLQTKPPERALGGTTVVTSGSFGGKPIVMRKKKNKSNVAVPSWAKVPNDFS